MFFQPRKLGPLEMKPCNNVEETDAQGFIDELTVLANMVRIKSDTASWLYGIAIPCFHAVEIYLKDTPVSILNYFDSAGLSGLCQLDLIFSF